MRATLFSIATPRSAAWRPLTKAVDRNGSRLQKRSPAWRPPTALDEAWLPGAGDGDSHAGIEDVDEEPLSVAGEGRTCPFAVQCRFGQIEAGVSSGDSGIDLAETEQLSGNRQSGQVLTGGILTDAVLTQ